MKRYISCLKNYFKSCKRLKKFNFCNTKSCCLAPHSTLNFDIYGNIKVCCFNKKAILGAYPRTSILDAWNSKTRLSLIKRLTNKDFSFGCNDCKLQIVDNNLSNAHFMGYQNYGSVISDMPVALEFECSNICNFECIMCGGEYSSSIRKNREHLPLIINPYDDNFISQVAYLLPYVKHISFLGGEPFLSSLYNKILDKVIEINPDVAVSITTNGSIFNERVERWLSLKNIFITLSLDSLIKKTFESIRVNSNFDIIKFNINKFLHFKKLKNIAFCPMIQNVKELPAIYTFCQENNLNLIINKVTEPLGGYKSCHKLMPNFSLNTLTKLELNKIIFYLSSFNINDVKYQNFISYLKSI